MLLFNSSAYLIWFACDLDEGLFAFEPCEHFLPFLAATHVCRDHMLVMCFCSTHRTVQGVYYYSRQFDCTKLGQFAIFRARKRQCCCQHWFFFSRGGWRGSGNRTEPCCTKEDYKDKTVVTHLKFEDTSGEKWSLSKSSCFWDEWQLAAWCALVDVTSRTENGATELLIFLALALKAETYRKPSPALLGEDIFNVNSADQIGQSCSWLYWINCVLVCGV